MKRGEAKRISMKKLRMPNILVAGSVCRGSPATRGSIPELRCLERFDVLEAIEDLATGLDEGRALAEPPPAFKRAWREAPACELDLVEVAV